MFGEWTETDRLLHLIAKFQPCGKKAKDDGTGAGLGLKPCKPYDDNDDF